MFNICEDRISAAQIHGRINIKYELQLFFVLLLLCVQKHLCFKQCFFKLPPCILIASHPRGSSFNDPGQPVPKVSDEDRLVGLKLNAWVG